MVTTPLRERMRQALRIRNMSPRTERTYLDNVARFALHFHLSPDRLGLPQIEQYLFFLRDEKKVSYCWFNQCVCGLRFFYLYVLDQPGLVMRIPYGRRERHLPVVLAVEELIAFLAAIGSFRDRVLLTVLYSARCSLDLLDHLVDYRRGYPGPPPLDHAVHAAGQGVEALASPCQGFVRVCHSCHAIRQPNGSRFSRVDPHAEYYRTWDPAGCGSTSAAGSSWASGSDRVSFLHNGMRLPGCPRRLTTNRGPEVHRPLSFR